MFVKTAKFFKTVVLALVLGNLTFLKTSNLKKSLKNQGGEKTTDSRALRTNNSGSYVSHKEDSILLAVPRARRSRFPLVLVCAR